MSRIGRIGLFGLAVLVALGSIGLGGWQINRLMERRARNAAAASQSALPAVDLTRDRLPEALAYRQVSVTGEYDVDHELVLRNRVLLGTPGVQIVTPLRVAGQDTAILVNRGFVPSPDAGPPPPGVRYDEAPRATVRGVAVPIPDAGDGSPVNRAGRESWQRLDLSALRVRLPYPVARYYVIAAADSTHTADHTVRGTVLPVRIEPPPLDEGPHLSYAIQWFMIAAAALGFGIVFVLRAGRTGAAAAPPIREDDSYPAEGRPRRTGGT